VPFTAFSSRRQTGRRLCAGFPTSPAGPPHQAAPRKDVAAGEPPPRQTERTSNQRHCFAALVSKVDTRPMTRTRFVSDRGCDADDRWIGWFVSMRKRMFLVLARLPNAQARLVLLATVYHGISQLLPEAPGPFGATAAELAANTGFAGVVVKSCRSNNPSTRIPVIGLVWVILSHCAPAASAENEIRSARGAEMRKATARFR
jgi:hypothetical protein